MILPVTYAEAIGCLALSFFLWGSWANFQRLAGKWRYELFYWDFSFGVLVVAILAALTLGSLKSSELSFYDNLLIASYHKIFYGFLVGLLLNLGNLLLVAALSVAPMAVAFPVSVGLGMVVGVGFTLFPPQGGLLLPLGGSVAVLAALILSGFTFSSYAQEQRVLKKPLAPDPRTPAPRPGPAPPPPAKGMLFSVLAGIVMGCAAPVASLSRTGEDGLGSYSAILLVGLATIFSTAIFSPFFLVFAVHGAPVDLRAYFKGSRKQHIYGLLGGGLWCLGLLATFASGGSLAQVQAGTVATRAFAGGAAILAAAWGWIAWREFKGGTYRTRMLLTAMTVIWIVGMAMLALTPNAAS